MWPKSPARHHLPGEQPPSPDAAVTGRSFRPESQEQVAPAAPSALASQLGGACASGGGASGQEVVRQSAWLLVRQSPSMREAIRKQVRLSLPTKISSGSLGTDEEDAPPEGFHALEDSALRHFCKLTPKMPSSGGEDSHALRPVDRVALKVQKHLKHAGGRRREAGSFANQLERQLQLSQPQLPASTERLPLPSHPHRAVAKTAHLLSFGHGLKSRQKLL